MVTDAGLRGGSRSRSGTGPDDDGLVPIARCATVIWWLSGSRCNGFCLAMLRFLSSRTATPPHTAVGALALFSSPSLFSVLILLSSSYDFDVLSLVLYE